MSLTKTTEFYTWECPSCGIAYGIPKDFADAKRRDGDHYFCPNGHPLSWSKSEADKLREELANEKAQSANWRERARRAQQDAGHFERSRNAYKGKVTHLKGKISEGLCPVCNHGFPNLKRHIEAKHPEFKLDEEA